MNCRHIADDQPRMLVDHHEPECAGDCTGCQPCHQPHCRACGKTHASSTCVGCVGEVRTALAEIVRLCGYPLLERLLASTRVDGVDEEPVHLVGPTANPEAWRQRGRYGHRYPADARMGEQHPYWVLGNWDMLVTEHLGHGRRTQEVTIPTAASYLDANLTWLAADMEFPFEVLRSDVKGCLSHLENVLQEGERNETGAPCMTCHVPLVKVYGDTEATDWWHCLKCREVVNDAQYWLAVRQAHLAEAEWLTDAEASERTTVKAGTIRRWAHDALVEKRTDSGRVVYRIQDIERLATEKGMMSA